MFTGQKKGTIRFGLVSATKPGSVEEGDWPSIDQKSTMSQELLK